MSTENTNLKKRVYITHPVPELALSMLREKGYDVTVGTASGIIPQKDIVKVLQKAEKKGEGYHAILTLLTDKIDSAILDAGTSLQVVSNYAIGYDNIDVVVVTKRGVTVTNAPGNYTDTIAEHVVALMLSVTTRTTEADRYVRKGLYKGWDPMIFTGTDLSGKIIGLIGAGRIGGRVAYHVAKGFDTKVVYFDTRPNEKIECDCGAKRMNTLNELLAVSDIVSLHVPLLPSTHHMVDDVFLANMKKTAYIINTSRGAVVDEKKLVEALSKKVIAGAALDVFEFEPKLSKGLTKLQNVVLTPHIASASEHARNEMARVSAQNIIDVFEGRVPVGNVTA
jgi:glyoxylate reductase